MGSGTRFLYICMVHALRVKIGCITTDLNTISAMDILINPRGLQGQLRTAIDSLGLPGDFHIVHADVQ